MSGLYTTKSGYEVAETILEASEEEVSNLSPMEKKKLWKNIWKVKTSLKIRHFM